jgi:DNA-binding transcriptional LysR family regulator
VDLEALRAFLAVVESGSFVAAATSLRWSRATLRRRVDELEAYAGVALLHRSEQGASPTPAGEMMAQRGREVLSQASALRSSVREIGSVSSGLLRVAMPVGMPPGLLSLLFRTLRTTHRAVRVHLRIAEDPLALLLHDVDVAVCFGDEPPEGPWVSREVLRIQERLVATRPYLDARGTPSCLEDLHQHEILLWESPEKTGPCLPLRAGGDFLITPGVLSADIHMLRRGAIDELGICFGPDAMLLRDVAPEPEMVPVLDELVGRERVLRVVFPSALPEIRSLVEVIDMLRMIVSLPSR